MNTNNVIIALQIMGKGMAGIFIATALIVAAVYLLGKLTAHDKSQKEAEQS